MEDIPFFLTSLWIIGVFLTFAHIEPEYGPERAFLRGLLWPVLLVTGMFRELWKIFKGE